MTRNPRLFQALFAVLLATSTPAIAQTSPDSLWNVTLQTVVVTATRSPSVLEDVPVPTRVIPAERIRARGAARLSDLLAEEPGMHLSHFLGTGIQLQGLDAAYTLILIDGQPVIGRSGGTLDLDRLPVQDIEAIEIVQGPSSSLWGSEALAGVINLRTRRPSRPLAGRVGWRRQSHDTVNWTGAVEGARAAWSWRIDADRMTSDGYDLHPETPGLTRPGFTSHTVSSRLDWNPDSRWKGTFNARIADESQVNRIGFDQDGQRFIFDQDGSRTDWSLSPEVRFSIRPGHTLTARTYSAQYGTRSELTTGVTESGSPETTRSRYSQDLLKAELQHDLIIGQWLILNSGLGAQREGAEADRIAGTARSNRTAWAFSQQQFLFGERWQLTTSLRWDQHTDYGSQVSPKAALLVKIHNTVRLRASVGTGFKAPSFQQLYMDYTNPVAGYSVIGSTDAVQLLRHMQEADQISVVLTDLSAFPAVTPESSTSFNISADADFRGSFHGHLSLFRNQVRDLIETQPVAIKTNGQQVFSYINLSRILTQGVNAELRWRPLPAWETSLGYQWLDARDRDVTAAIDAGTLYGRRDGRDYRLTRSDYGGLFGRSRYSGTFQVSWDPTESPARINLRGTWRSRAGYGDRNGNLILDADEEYLPAYMLWNATASYALTDRLSLQSGIINLLGFTHPDRIPSLSGRQFFLSVNLSSF